MGTLDPVTTPLGGGTADLVAELRAQAEAAVIRAAETKDQVAREVVEVRAQADAVAAALDDGARQAADRTTADGERLDATVLAEARAQAASAIAEAEAKAASIRVTAAEAADDAAAALARAEVRRDSAAVQADALRLTARREATMNRRQQLDDIHQVAHGQLDSRLRPGLPPGRHPRGPVGDADRDRPRDRPAARRHRRLQPGHRQPMLTRRRPVVRATTPIPTRNPTYRRHPSAAIRLPGIGCAGCATADVGCLRQPTDTPARTPRRYQFRM